MKKRIYAISQKIIRPITEDTRTFFLLILLLLLPIMIYRIPAQDWAYVLYSAPINVIVAYALCLTLSVCGRCVNIVRRVLVGALYVVAIIECFMVLFFGVGCTATMISLLMNTNGEEALGFISNYLYTRQFLLFVLGVVSMTVILMYCRLMSFWNKVEIKSFVLSVSIAACLLIGVIVHACRDVRSLVFYTSYTDLQTLLYNREEAFFSANYTVIGSAIFNSVCYFKESGYKSQLIKSQGDGELSARMRSPQIVLIIGEAFNKYHSSLYHYDVDTNPLLQIEQQEGRLFVFGDVVTPYNTTINCMRSIFSMKSQEQEEAWYETPLFPILYRRSGYYVEFYSNQEVAELNKSLFDFGNNWLVSSDIAPLLFDAQNTQRWDMDMELVELYKEGVGDLDKHTLTIFHLMGQHAAYHDRYPISEAKCVADCYSDRAELNIGELGVLAHYDNATLYNDKVVVAILDQFRDKDAIVIYLSDHGEEVFDYRHFSGRDLSENLTPERAKYQFEVPFMIWMSDKYKENHPDVVAQVERSVDRPFMIDDLPHLMLDLAGIECEWFDPTRSVINDQFNEKRKRLLLDSKQDYDVIMGRRND